MCPGNYLISGGDETVLKIWQLSTEKQENLPHLTAAIEDIVVSPSGASYAVSLANNSLVVISTTELQAKTNIIGIQSRRVDMEQRTQKSLAKYSFDIFSRVPMAVDPKNANHLLFSAPGSQPRYGRRRVPPEPYLQTFDINSQRPLTRQALTRNNATDPNVTPDGRNICEPTVKFIQTSKDGKWLATVDEWMPPPVDINYLDDGVPESTEEERNFRREVYLKFWRWDEKSLQWVLDSRIDAPHFFEDVGASARVLDLVSDPSSLGFATVGDDRFVRIWRPKTRLRNGTIVRGANQNTGSALITWSLELTIELSSSLDAPEPTSSIQASSAPLSSHLAFSADGSVIAAGISWNSAADPGVIHIVDALAGTVRRSITEVDATALSCIGILGRHMIVIGQSIIVWDLVVDELVYSVPLTTAGINPFDRTSMVQLAMNASDGTFAVSAPQFVADEKAGHRFQKASSKVSIFDTNRARTLWSSTIPAIVLSLVSAVDSKGYIALDSLSCVQTISPSNGSMQLITPPPEPTPEVIRRDQDEGEAEEEQLEEPLTGSEVVFEVPENDKPVVRPEELQQIFDIGPMHVLPPVKLMLDAVVGLYARKPRTSGTA
jgi:NET1-associated nuclear protein 1 (U3 small nucleolar RNA-associated protein 17)